MAGMTDIDALQTEGPTTLALTPTADCGQPAPRTKPPLRVGPSKCSARRRPVEIHYSGQSDVRRCRTKSRLTRKPPNLWRNSFEWGSSRRSGATDIRYRPQERPIFGRLRTWPPIRDHCHQVIDVHVQIA